MLKYLISPPSVLIHLISPNYPFIVHISSDGMKINPVVELNNPFVTVWFRYPSRTHQLHDWYM